MVLAQFHAFVWRAADRKPRWNVLDSLLVSLSLFEEFYGRLAVDDGRRVDMHPASILVSFRLQVF